MRASQKPLVAQAVSRFNSALGGCQALWNSRQSYQDQGADYYEKQYRQRVIKNLSKIAKTLVFTLIEAHSN